MPIVSCALALAIFAVGGARPQWPQGSGEPVVPDLPETHWMYEVAATMETFHRSIGPRRESWHSTRRQLSQAFAEGLPYLERALSWIESSRHEAATGYVGWLAPASAVKRVMLKAEMDRFEEWVIGPLGSSVRFTLTFELKLTQLGYDCDSIIGRCLQIDRRINQLWPQYQLGLR